MPALPPPRQHRPCCPPARVLRWRALPALLAAGLLLAACGRAQPSASVAAPLGDAVATAVPASPTSPPSATPEATAVPSATAIPATATAAATATLTPNAGATAAARAAAAAAATRSANEAKAVDHLGAGNTLRQAGNLAGALHEYATAQALAPDRADVRSAMATAQAMATATAHAAATAQAQQTAQAGATAQAEQTAQAAPASTGPAMPLRLLIPAIGVNAPIEYVGLTGDGAMDVPQGWWDVGWFKYGTVPGQPGNAVIDGHLDSTTGPAVFWHLGDMGPGGQIVVTMTDGSAEHFVIRQRVSYPYNGAPLDQIFGATSSTNLNLITCGGTWNFFQHNYSNRMVLYSQKAG